MLRTPGIGEVAADVEVDVRPSDPDGMEFKDVNGVVVGDVNNGGAIPADLEVPDLAAGQQGGMRGGSAPSSNITL